jgi:hypothetical protein
MPKARIALFSAVFLVFAIIGFGLAYYFRFRLPTQVTAAPQQDLLVENSQQNLLVIHIDDLQDPDPNLISVWVVFFVSHDRTYLSFKSLYPDPLSNHYAIQVDNRFSLNQEGMPGEDFLEWVQKQSPRWTAFLIIDQVGLDSIASYLNSPELEQIVPRNHDQLTAVWQQEARLIDHLCQYMQLDTEKTTKFEWKQLIPEHIRSDLTIENALQVWDQIEIKNATPHCEVYGLNSYRSLP